MFDDVCLTCSKPVFGSRAYCCDECALNDLSTPSLSSTSSVYSSPALPYHQPNALQDVPPLLLNTTTTNSGRHARKRSSISSSSASSCFSTPSAPALTDDDESISDIDRDVLDLRYHSVDVMHDKAMDGEFEPINLRATRPFGLSYARRPSTTNTRSTIPIPISSHRSRSGSDAQKSPPAAPDDGVNENDADDLSLSNLSLSLSSNPHRRHRHHHHTKSPSSTILSKSKRHTRGSLPAYFSLLQMGVDSSVRGSVADAASPSSTLRQSLEDQNDRASPDTPTAGGRLTPLAGLVARINAHGLVGSPPVASALSRATSRDREDNETLERHRRQRIDSMEKVQDWVHTSAVPTATSSSIFGPPILRSRSPSPSKSKSRSRSRSPPMHSQTRAIDVTLDVQTACARGRPSRRRMSSRDRDRLVATEPAPYGGALGLDLGFVGSPLADACAYNERGRGRDVVERGWERERGRTESRGRRGRFERDDGEVERGRVVFAMRG